MDRHPQRPTGRLRGAGNETDDGVLALVRPGVRAPTRHVQHRVVGQQLGRGGEVIAAQPLVEEVQWTGHAVLLMGWTV